ncbi:DHA2 family efflux MFS transporter permease subunit [Nakamurella sp. YIM 132087]|uniref:DHA2 family efflux MFS transporter permease subunit n=1 Tax=Nakamurella alba TaxID=2665158 RepID=A0A7K1FLE7_9ACTN|nr:DHA2 family efflux MFS transporter permease subunit [Nakamurella alba]MTD14965.1 DHA2 family efflux MFS transporter permease subunit [Nakamurella alba]
MTAPADGNSRHLTFRSARGRGVLWATVLGSGLAQLDATIVTVALPRIGQDLGAGLVALQWTLNAYTLTLSGLLLLGGALGDRRGRRRIFQIGVIWFTLASIGCAAAPNVSMLIGMRALQGIGAALLTPGSLAILQAVFRKEDRGTAVGAWSGLGGVAGALGPVLGGVLIGWGEAGWRLAFLINVPIGAVVVWLARHYIPETRDEQATGRLDVLGAGLASLGLAGVVYGLTDGPAGGWPWPTVLGVAVGAALLGLFVLRQARAAHPLMPLVLFRNRQFSATNLVTLAVYAALAGGLFLLPVALQVVAGFSPLAAGTATLPLTAVMLVLSPVAGRVSTRIGPRWPMTVGPIVAGAGMALFTRIDADSSYLTDILPAVLVFALGLSATVAPLTTTVLAAAPNHLAGIASAINNDVARIAGLLAVAVLPGLAGITPAVYADAVALTSGFHRAVLLAGALCAAGGVLAALTIRRTPLEALDDD